MPVAYKNLTGYVKGLINGTMPDVGQVHYLVDSDFRTAAQGWSRADGTGPLDLFGQRNPGYVYRTGDYANDAAAAQALIDAAIDERGDVMHFTPGAYSIGTALAINVNGLRIFGPPTRSRRRGAAIVTGTVDNTFDITAVDVEMAYLIHVPLTVGASVRLNAADRFTAHNLMWDASGVAASTSTEGFDFVTAEPLFPEFYECEFIVDAAQGDAMNIAFTQDLYAEDCRFISRAGTWASVITAAASTDHAHFHRCYFGGEGAFTNLFTGAAGADLVAVTECYVHGGALATATAIETGFDGTLGIDIAENYQTGDATLQGGTLITLA